MKALRIFLAIMVVVVLAGALAVKPRADDLAAFKPYVKSDQSTYCDSDIIKMWASRSFMSGPYNAVRVRDVSLSGIQRQDFVKLLNQRSEQEKNWSPVAVPPGLDEDDPLALETHQGSTLPSPIVGNAIQAFWNPRVGKTPPTAEILEWYQLSKMDVLRLRLLHFGLDPLRHKWP